MMNVLMLMLTPAGILMLDWRFVLALFRIPIFYVNFCLFFFFLLQLILKKIRLVFVFAADLLIGGSFRELAIFAKGLVSLLFASLFVVLLLYELLPFLQLDRFEHVFDFTLLFVSENVSEHAEFPGFNIASDLVRIDAARLF